MKTKRFVSFLLAVVMLVSIMLTGVTVATAEVLPFTDVASDAWYYSAVESVYSSGLMKGKTDTAFDPTANMSRAEFVTVLSRLAAINAANVGFSDSLDFDDTDTAAWYADAAGWAVETGLTNGTSATTFSPTREITRQEMAVLIVRFVKYLGESVPDNAKVDAFADADKIADWANADIETMRKYGLIQGDANGNFNPEGNADRASVATIAMRLLPLISTVEIVENGKSDYVIVANELGSDAAERVQYQIEYMTGVKLDIVDSSSSAKAIVLGGTDIDTSRMVEDSYEIKIDGNKVIIDGATSEGIYRGAAKFVKAHCFDGAVKFAKGNSAEKYDWSYPIGKLTVNGNDISKYTVQYPSDASEKTVIGVNDIVEYIKLATGVEIKATTDKVASYAIIVEEKRVDVDGQIDNIDNFSVKSEGNNIRISGSAERGAMYGCYDFLEQCVGCRFLTEDVDYIIPAEALDIKDVDYSETPGFIYREQYTAVKSSDDMLNKLRDASPVWTGGSCHTFDALDGDFSSQYDNQPCLSSEEVYQTMLANVMKLLDANPDAKLISVSQNDNLDYCTCDKCVASYEKYSSNGEPEGGGAAGNMLEFINRIATEVEKKYPDVIIHMFAYTYTKTPPVGIKAHKNVMVQLCTDYCCRKHSYLGGCTGNQTIKNAVEGWNEIVEHLYIWDYRTGGDGACPEIMNTKILDDAKDFAANGSLGVFSQGNWRSSNDAGFFELRTYLVGKVYWDPYMTEEEYFSHINDFVTGFYGKKAGEFITKAESLYESNNKFCNNGDGDATGFIVREVEGVINDVMDNMRLAALTTDSKESFIYADRSIIQFWCLKIECEWRNGYGTSDEMDEYLNNESKALQKQYKKYNIIPQNFEVFPDLDVFTAPPSGWGAMLEELLGEGEE